jgi:hypothetical protein
VSKYDFKGFREGAFAFLKRNTSASDSLINGTLNTAARIPGRVIPVRSGNGGKNAEVLFAEDNRFEIRIL